MGNGTKLLHVEELKPLRRKRRANNGSLPGPDETVSRAQLERLQAFAAELASPLPLARIAAVVGEAAMELLDAEIVVVAVHVDDPRHLRGVHIAGIPRTVTIGCPRLPATRRAWSRRSTGCSAATPHREIPGRSPYCRSSKSCALAA